MLMIRLARVGARKQPHYRIVVIEKDRARNGRSVEVVGTYNPRTEPASYELKRDRIDYWVKNGAQLSVIVAKLLKKPVAAPAEAVAATSPETKVDTTGESKSSHAEQTETTTGTVGTANRVEPGSELSDAPAVQPEPAVA